MKVPKKIHLDDTFDNTLDTDSNTPIKSQLPISKGEFLVHLTGTAKYEDPECPDDAYEGSPTCDGVCIFVPDYDNNSSTPVIIGWTECCVGCADGEYCHTPNKSLLFYTIIYALQNANTNINLNGVVTNCGEPYENLAADEFKFPGGGDLWNKLQSFFDVNTKRGLLTVQSVHDPAQFTSRLLSLGPETLRLNLPRQGWRVTVTPNHLPESDADFPHPPVIRPCPEVNPSSTIETGDKALSASIVLPEQGGARQYWVTVPESSRHPQAPFRYTMLVTAEWTVTFLRIPLSSAKKEDCGCK